MEEAPWEAVGLVREPGRRDRFACTDNLTGWFEGFTHSVSLGQGYMVRDTFVFRGWRSTLDGRPLDRTVKALSDTVFPWGHRVDYPDGTREELLLHSGRRVLSLRISCPTKTVPAIETDLAPLPRGLLRSVVEQRTPEGLVVHLAFGESKAELAANIEAARAPGAWEAEVSRRWTELSRAWLLTDDEEYNLALFWASASARSFVTQEFGTGIWAGLPWFKDNWGRDTFIALPGALLCSGAFATARAVLDNFARYQNTDPLDRNEGRIPNRVNVHEILYNTVDGTPWLIRELEEYLRHTGDRGFARGLRPLIRRYVDGALKNHVDPEGLLRHDDADTWMDARIAGKQPWSPRGDRAVEIQALWIEALDVGLRLASADQDEVEAAFYRALSAKARSAFVRSFAEGGRLVDRLDQHDAADSRERPNALMLAWINESLPIDESVLEATTRHLAETLLLPWGVLSLNPGHADFHPRHENPARWHKDAAYHNGTVWGWNAGFAVTALNRFGWQERAWELTRNLTNQILNLGCVGSMSELVDALPGPQGEPVPSGTFSQAWSVSEFVRNAYQDYLGWHPDLPRGELRFRPALPADWKEVRARLPYGLQGEALTVDVTQEITEDGLKQVWVFEGPVSLPLLVIEVPTGSGGTPGSRSRREIEPTGIRTRVEVLLPAARTDLPTFAALERPPSGWPVESGSDGLLHRILNSR